MPIMQRIESLRKRHSEVESLLHTEETRPAKNEDRIHELKKEKLTLKDEISRLEVAAGAAA